MEINLPIWTMMSLDLSQFSPLGNTDIRIHTVLTTI